MALTTAGKSLYQLGLSCLLVINLLVWSSPFLAVVGEEGQFEQLAGRLHICLDLQPRATSFSDIVKAVQGRFD